MLRSNPHLPLLLAMSALFAMTSCGSKSNKKSAASDPSAVTIAGSLNLKNTSSANGLKLADSTDYSAFKLVCNTLGNKSESCNVTVNQDGTFAGNCANFKNSSAGCVLQESGKVIGNVVFNQNAVITPDAGTVSATVTIDTTTGNLDTSVDVTKSTALSTNNTQNLTVTAWQTPIAGSWTTTCSTDQTQNKSYNGHDSCPDGQQLYIAAYDATNNIYSIWQSKGQYDVCVPAQDSTYSEHNPYWQVSINGDATQIVPLQFSTIAKLEASLDAVYAALPSVIKTSVNNTAIGIAVRAGQLAQTVDAIRAASTKDFGGVLQYRVPSQTELKRRLTLKLLQLNPLLLADTSFCGPLILDETLPSMYRRTHSLEPELICQFNSDGSLAALKTFYNATMAKTCLPNLFYDAVYNTTAKAEEVVLKCVGSSATDGSCLDATSAFIGQINGRFNVMQLDERYGGAFDLYQKQSTQLLVVNPTEGLLPCAIQTESVIEGYKDSDNHFKASVANRVVNSCDGSGASKDVSDWYGDRVTAAVKRLTTMFSAEFTRS